MYKNLSPSEFLIKCLIIGSFKKPIEHIKSYDFSDLFSNIKHEDLKKALYGILDLTMKDGICDSLEYKKGKISYCSYIESEEGWHREELKEIIEVFLANYYIKVGDCCFSQVTGSPMGGSASAVISDLCLAYFEYLYFKTRPAYKFLICRYVDDIMTSDPEFFEKYKEIYPSNLVLTQDSSETGSSCSFLDLEVFIIDKKLQYKTFDKRDKFNFKATKYSEGSTCLPNYVKTAIFTGEINRYITTNCSLHGFFTTVRNLMRNLKERNYQLPFRKLLLKTINKQMHRLTKFGSSYQEIMNQVKSIDWENV